MSHKMFSKMPVVQIEATPSTSLVDEKVNIRIRGLLPAESVTVAASLDESLKEFVSYAHYTADEHGEVDLQSDESLGGTYTGVEQMGLFWSMTPAAGQRPGIRLMKKNVTEPFRVIVYVVSKHITVKTKDDSLRGCMASVELKTYYMATGVKKFNVKEMDKTTRIRGTLFLPPGPGPFPGVVDMFGGVGGLTEYRAALLASRGFASLALAYFAYDDLPTERVLALEYFIEAADWLHGQAQVMKSGIGVVGVCKGGELAIRMSVLNHKVKAVIAINTHYYTHSAVHTLGGVEQPSVKADLSYAKITGEGFDIGDCLFMHDAPEETVLRVEDAKQARFLFLCGSDDRQAVPGHVHKLKERFDRHGLMNNYRVLEYHKAGHLLEPPYTPLTRTAFDPFMGGLSLFGGETKPHADAQEHSWKEIQSFLWEQLTPNDSKL